MMKDEFEKLLGKQVSEAEYEVIELVYTWHPSIKDTEGKKQMVELYTGFGMAVIRAMVPVAEKMVEMDKERNKLKAKMELISRREELLREGNMSLEEIIGTIDAMYMKCETPESFEAAIKNLEIDEEVKATARKILEV